MGCNRCSSGKRNTGLKKSVTRETILSLGIIPLIADDGTPNFIDTTTPFTQMDLDALINNPDPSKRLYPIKDLISVDDITEDPVFQDFDDDSRAVLREGRGTFTAMILEADSAYKRKIDNLLCTYKVGAFLFDRCENIEIDRRFVSAQGQARPLPIHNPSFYTKLMKATNSQVSAVMIGFDWKRFFNDGDIGLLAAGVDIEEDVFVTEADGLLDLCGDPAENISTTGFDMLIKTDFGSSNGTPQSGLKELEFKVFNESTQAYLTLDGVTESESIDGKYLFDYSSTPVPPVPTDVLHVEYDGSGFDDRVLQTEKVIV